MGISELAFGTAQVLSGGPGLREPAPDGVADEMVVESVRARKAVKRRAAPAAFPRARARRPRS